MGLPPLLRSDRMVYRSPVGPHFDLMCEAHSLCILFDPRFLKLMLSKNKRPVLVSQDRQRNKVQVCNFLKANRRDIPPPHEPTVWYAEDYSGMPDPEAREQMRKHKPPAHYCSVFTKMVSKKYSNCYIFASQPKNKPFFVPDGTLSLAVTHSSPFMHIVLSHAICVACHESSSTSSDSTLMKKPQPRAFVDFVDRVMICVSTNQWMPQILGVCPQCTGVTAAQTDNPTLKHFLEITEPLDVTGESDPRLVIHKGLSFYYCSDKPEPQSSSPPPSDETKTKQSVSELDTQDNNNLKSHADFVSQGIRPILVDNDDSGSEEVAPTSTTLSKKKRGHPF